MSRLTILKSILTEYGVGWAFNRARYSAKLSLLCRMPKTESWFEKKVSIKRLDIFQVKADSLSCFLKDLPQSDQEDIISIADKAGKGQIKGFSSVELDYGYPINWQLNPLTGKSCSIKDKWYRIKDFDKARGDIKLIWEASRFTHFYYLARAFLLTQDSKYYQAFSEQLEDWLKNNPYSYGVNYKCGQECALRMLNSLLVYRVFAACGMTKEKDKVNITDLVSRCYRKILANFFYAHKCIKNNHTLSELCGMIVGSWCCEDTATLKKAYRLLEQEIEKQFTPDGGYRQFSFNYQRFALQICECVLSLSPITGLKLSDASLERLKKSALLLYQCQSESGDLPNYGSNDGALIFPLTCCGYRDFRPVINTTYALTTGQRMYQSGVYDEELFWFGGGNLEIEAVKRESSSFAEAGLYTVRGTDSFAMICLNNYNSRPAHMDQLHFDLWYQGQNIFCDGGTHSYASELGEKLVLTASHNTLKIAGKEQMNKRGNFLIYGWTKAAGINKTANRFEGISISQNGYRHKRCVEISENVYTITDECEGNEYEILFHTPFSISIDGNKARITDNQTLLCTLECSQGEMTASIGYRSLYYLSYEEISVLHIKNINKSTIIKIKLGVNSND